MGTEGKFFRFGLEKVTAEERRKRLYFILKLLAVGILAYLAVRYWGWHETFGISERFIKAALFYVPTNLLISFTRLALVYLYLQKHNQQRDFRDNFILGIDKIASLLSFFSLIITLFLLFNVDVKEFFTSISIVAAAIAIIFKDYLSNMINGLIIMFTDQLSLNDDVKVGNQKGKIINITLINVHLLNEDDDLIYIPNNAVFSTDIINYTKHSINRVSVDFEMSREQLGTLNELEEYMRENLTPYAKYINYESIEVKVDKINRDFVRLKFQCTLLKHSGELEREIRKFAAEGILKFISERSVKA